MNADQVKDALLTEAIKHLPPVRGNAASLEQKPNPTYWAKRSHSMCWGRGFYGHSSKVGKELTLVRQWCECAIKRFVAWQHSWLSENEAVVKRSIELAQHAEDEAKIQKSDLLVTPDGKPAPIGKAGGHILSP